MITRDFIIATLAPPFKPFSLFHFFLFHHSNSPKINRIDLSYHYLIRLFTWIRVLFQSPTLALLIRSEAVIHIHIKSLTGTRLVYRKLSRPKAGLKIILLHSEKVN